MPSGHPSVTARWVRLTEPAWHARARRRPEATWRENAASTGPSVAPSPYRSVDPPGSSERTRVIDGEVAHAIGHGTAQVVLLGTGYDGRALRFGGGTVRWFEVDLPAVQADKRQRLGALGIEPGGVTYVGFDLQRGDLGAALHAAGTMRRHRRCSSARTWRPTSPWRRRRPCRNPARPCVGRQRPGGRLRGDTRAGCVRPGAPRHDGRAPCDDRGARRNEFRPGDPEKLMVVTGWQRGPRGLGRGEQGRPGLAHARPRLRAGSAR